jgi:hypothetical protein
MKIFVLLFCVFSLASLASAQSTEWINFSSPEGRFSVLLPAQPTFESNPGEIEGKDAKTGATLPGKVRFTSNLYMSRGSGEAYLVGWADYEAGFKFDTQGEIAANRDNFVNGIKAQLVSQRKITLGGNPGLEFTAKKDAMNIQARVYIFGRRPYILVAMSADPAVPNADKFFTSFTFAKR